MIRYILRKIKNDQSPVFNRWFAYPVVEETVNLSNLAKHMASHNTPFSAGVIKGLLTDMINCIKELLLEGKNVKIDDLAIFSLGNQEPQGRCRVRRRVHRHPEHRGRQVPRPCHRRAHGQEPEPRGLHEEGQGRR